LASPEAPGQFQQGQEQQHVGNRAAASSTPLITAQPQGRLALQAIGAGDRQQQGEHVVARPTTVLLSRKRQKGGSPVRIWR
jgi:hypothetical protein